MSSSRRPWRRLITSLSNQYFRPREREASIYERLGVRRFKRYLPTGGDIYANLMKWHPILDRADGLVATLSRFERRTRLAETTHLVTFIFFATIAVVGFAAGGRLVFIFLLTMFNVGFNVYPIMVQRYNRHRLLRLLERRDVVANGSEAG